MSPFGKIVAAVVMGFVGGVFAFFVVGLMSGGGQEGAGPGGWGFLVGLVAVAVIALRAASVAKAWGWGLLICGLLAFLFPVATLVMSGVMMAGEQAGAAQVGIAIGGGMVAMFTGFVGFIVGLVLVIPGIVLILKG